MAFLVIGLGNPGEKYEKTRHNAGARVVKRLAGSFAEKYGGFGAWKEKFGGLVCEGRIDGKKTVLMRAASFYMNESGLMAKQAAAFWKISPKNAVVIYDDKDLPAGRIRVRPEGSSGGHKGMQSVIDQLGTQKIPRVRLGIASPLLKRTETADFVLKKPPAAEDEKLREAEGKAAAVVETIIKEGLPKAMSEFNR